MVKRSSASLRAAIALSLATALASPLFAASNEVGITSAVVNEVSIRNSGASQAHQARLREHLALADAISTGGNSRLQVLLLDKSTFTVGANAQLTIDRFVYDPQGSPFGASVAKGAFRFLSGGRGHKGGSTIRTPVATIGIRGTIVDGIVGAEALAVARMERQVTAGMTVDPETATLVVLRGPGPETTGRVTIGDVTVTAGGQSVELDRPLMAVFVPAPGATPGKPFTISLPGLARLNGLILPSASPVLSGEGAPYPAPRPRPAYRPPGYPYGPYPPDRPYPPDLNQGGDTAPGISGFPTFGEPMLPNRPDPGQPSGGTAPTPSPTPAPTPAPSPTGPPPTNNQPPPNNNQPNPGPTSVPPNSNL